MSLKGSPLATLSPFLSRGSWAANHSRKSLRFFRPASDMIAFPMDPTRRVHLSLIALSLCFLAARPSVASHKGSAPPPNLAFPGSFSADSFDWRGMVPYLFAAADLPGQQGIKAILENTGVLRAYVANEIRLECKPQNGACAAVTKDQVTKRIDEIVEKDAITQHKTISVEYSMSRQPFPFSEIGAMKSEKSKDAYLILSLSDHSYTGSRLQAKYGPPYDTDIFQQYGLFKYRMDSPQYSSKAIFEIDPVDGAVIRISLSLKAKKSR
jgi:hypothetical protein